MSVCVRALMSVCKGPYQTVATRLREHSKTLMFAQHLRASMGTSQYISNPQTHTHKPFKSNETARPRCIQSKE